MKLSDCTKAELLWVIQRAKENSLGSINGYLDHALSDLHWKRAQDRMKRAEPNIPRLTTKRDHRKDRLQCLGNVVVPQQFYPVFQAIADIERGIVHG